MSLLRRAASEADSLPQTPTPYVRLSAFLTVLSAVYLIFPFVDLIVFFGFPTFDCLFCLHICPPSSTCKVAIATTATCLSMRTRETTKAPERCVLNSLCMEFETLNVSI